MKYQSFVCTQLNDQTVLFQQIQFGICTQFKCQTVLFDPKRETYRVNQGAMAARKYSTFPKALVIQKTHHLTV